MSKDIRLKYLNMKLQAYKKIMLELENEMEELHKEKDDIMEVK
jgi:hypothetical protein